TSSTIRQVVTLLPATSVVYAVPRPTGNLGTRPLRPARIGTPRRLRVGRLPVPVPLSAHAEGGRGNDVQSPGTSGLVAPAFSAADPQWRCRMGAVARVALPAPRHGAERRTYRAAHVGDAHHPS